MFGDIDKQANDLNFIEAFRNECKRRKIDKRAKALEISLTAGQLAFAVDEWLKKIEKREKSKNKNKRNIRTT